MPPPGSNSIEILLIDDDALSREVLTLLLTAQGYTVHTADSGDAALDHLQRSPGHPPHVVLTDLQMPGLTGTALAHRLRAACSGISPQTLLLAMSGSQPDESVCAGFDGFLLKPFTMQDFAAALTTHQDAIQPTGPAPMLIAAENLDEGQYKKLADAMPREQLQQLYALCLGDVAARVARMQAAAATRDDALYRREAHAIKGGCGMVGATQLHTLAAKLEEAGIAAANHVASLQEMLLLCERLRGILIAR